MIRTIRLGIAVALAIAGSAAYCAEAPGAARAFNIPPGDLAPALESLAKETGLELIFQPGELKGIRTQGVTGTLSPQEAVVKLISGTRLTMTTDAAGAILISATANKTSQDAREAPHSLRVAQATAGDPTSQSGIPAAAKASETSSVTIHEVIVTATKRAEKVQDIPLSIAVIGNQDIERRGLIGMEDYLRSIPGVNQLDGGGADNAIVIRGITTSPQFENFSSGTTVASYFDEAPITAAAGMAAGGIDVRPVDIERIEVLRGPQGTAYGSSSLGGTVRMISMKPKLDAFSARVAASYSDTSGGGDNSMMQGIVNIPLVKDELAVRAVGYRYDESGYYRNIAGIHPATIARAEAVGLGDYVRGFVQDDVGRMLSIGGRLAVSWQATDDLNLSLSYLTQKIEQDGAPSASVGKYEQAHLPIAPQARVRGEAGEVADTDIDLLSFVLDYDLGWAALTAATSWIESGSVYARDVTEVFPFPTSTTLPSDFESFTAEARLASQFDGPLQVLAGVFYEDVKDGSTQTLDWPGTPASSPAGTTPMFYAAVDRQLDQRAVFGEVSYDLTDQLTATVGGRYFKYERDERSLLEGGFNGVAIGAGVPVVLQNSDDGSTFKASLAYKPTADSLLYATWAEGFRLGRPAAGLPAGRCDVDSDGLVDGTSVSIESTRSIESDFLENYEVGAKFMLFERRMEIDAAVYHIEWDGLPVRQVPPCLLAYTANVGSATSDGVELQARLFVVEGLRLDFGGSYNEAELSKDAPGLGASEGDRLPGSPKVSVNLAAQYDFEVAGRDAFVRADSFYAGKFYGDLLQSPVTMAGDYVKVDARAGVEIGALSVELFVRNLTDEDAFTWRGLNAIPITEYRLRPRTIGIQLGYSFE